MCKYCDNPAHKINKDLKGRLMNFKFRSAASYLVNEPEDVTRLVRGLSDMFGNVGMMFGAMGDILSAALDALGTWDEDL